MPLANPFSKLTTALTRSAILQSGSKPTGLMRASAPLYILNC